MCGIFAAYSPNKKFPFRLEDYKKATTSVLHRGPDHIGTYSTSSIFLGHTRLSIIDRSKASDQPFQYRNIYTSFNGEIFNYKEIRSQLSNRGHLFTTYSDTEVLAAAFYEWGVDCFTKLNGMWTAVFYDETTDITVVSRDRFGQKPLFYALKDTTWHFASEIHQLQGLVTESPDYFAIQSFLLEGDFNLQGRTFFNNIYEFPPASYLILSGDQRPSLSTYWKYPQSAPSKTTNDDFIRFNELLQDSIRLRINADVPVGICLSGGVDSTLIADQVVALPNTSPDMILAVSYDSDSIDSELPYAQAVAIRLGLPFKFTQIDTASLDTLPLLIYRLGRGHSSPAILPYDQLQSLLSSEGRRVSLDGQGADELLGGYKTFYIYLVSELLLKGHFRQCFDTIRQLLGQSKQFSGNLSLLYLPVMFLRTSGPAAVRRLMRRLFGYSKFFRNSSIKPYCYPTLEWPLLSIQQPGNSFLNNHLIAQHSQSLRNLIYYGDVIAMSNSVENRSPFLDHRLVEHVFQKDYALKVNSGKEKISLRNHPSYEKYIDILDRDKVGFQTPFTPCMLNKMTSSLLHSPILSWPIFNSEQLQRAIHTAKFNKSKFHRILFRLYQVHIWHNVFYTQNSSEAE